MNLRSPANLSRAGWLTVFLGVILATRRLAGDRLHFILIPTSHTLPGCQGIDVNWCLRVPRNS